MKEKEIRAKAINELNGWVTWNPPATRSYQSKDIFKMADLICWKGKRIKFIQLSTLTNETNKKRQVGSFFKENPTVEISRNIMVEIWLWNKKKREFKKIVL